MKRVRRALPLVLVLLGLVAAVILAGPRGQEGLPLDPRSTGPLGTKALVDTLRELGADVRVTDAVPGPEVDIALVLADVLDEAQRDGLREWVAHGGRLVLTDPTSELAPEVVASTTLGLFEPTLAKRCDLPALRDVERVDAAGGVVYEAGDVRCFPRNDGAWLAATAMGEGVIVALGGPEVFVNEHLGIADNALLAAALLAPAGQGAGGRVAVLRPPQPGEGSSTLIDLLPSRIRVAFVQLGVAFLLVVAWRARRLGQPVIEPLPVRIPGSKLVVAVGNLLQQTRGRRRSAALLRTDLRRTLAERLGLPASAPTDAVAAAALARAAGRLDHQTILAALDGPEPANEDDLVRLAREVEHVRQVFGGEGGRGAPAGAWGSHGEGWAHVD